LAVGRDAVLFAWKQMPAMGELFAAVTMLFDPGMESNPICPGFSENARKL
jgi:hypothetical protein